MKNMFNILNSILLGLFGLLAIIFAVIGFILYNMFSWGFVLYKFWYWFILPIFNNLPEISYLESVGIFLFIALFKVGNYQKMKDEFIDYTTMNIVNVISPWITILFGYCIYYFVL